jgi:hypothetical protein
MIYLAPLMLIGSALVLESRRIDWRIVALASAFVVFLIYEKPLQLLYPYFEAPGFGILTIANRHWRWDVGDLRLALRVARVVAIALLLLRRRHPAMLALTALLVMTWMLTSEITTTVGFTNFANKIRSSLPAHLDWVDRATGGRHVTYLGQVGPNKDPNNILLTEFPADSDFVLADIGVRLQAKPVARWEQGQMTLYEKRGPWRLVDAQQQVFSDGWAPGWSTYTYFRPNQHGTLEVTLSRTAYNGDAPPGKARVEVSTVGFDPKRGGPVQGKVFATKRTLVRNGQQETLRFEVAQTPVRVEINISPTFRSSVSDPRQLGAQVGFEFHPAT